MGGRFRQAGARRGEDRLHSADRLLVRGDGLRDGLRQEVRHQDHPQQGSLLGRRARQAGQRRAPRGPRAVRPRLWPAPGHRRSQEGHGRADDPQQQRPGDHPVERPQGQGRGGWRLAGQGDCEEGQGIHLRPDLPHRHPRHVAVLLAGGPRHRPLPRREEHRGAAPADGGQHARRQHGRLLRGRAVESAGDRRQDRLSPR
jgi:hypothetical protein